MQTKNVKKPNKRGGKLGMKNNKQFYCSRTESQRQRIFDALRKEKSIHTFYCRDELLIPHPAARILELKCQGHKIYTSFIYVADRAGVEHRIGSYVLIKEAPYVN